MADDPNKAIPEQQRIAEYTREIGEAESSTKSFGQALKEASQVATQFEVSTQQVVGAIDSIASKIPIVGSILGTFVGLWYQITKASLDTKYALTKVNVAYGELEKTIHRQNAAMTKLQYTAVNLGQTFETTKDQVSRLAQFMSGDVIGLGQQNQGLIQFNAIAAASGLTFETMANLVSASYRKMGLSMDESFESIAEMHDIAGKFGLNINKVAQDIYGAAQGLEIFGITGRSVTPVYQAFLEVLGKGRKFLAEDLTKEFVGGLTRMSEGFKSFFGVMGGMGGGGGALASMFEFERMFEEEDIAGLGESIGNTLVDVTGQGLMTKYEAISKGQTDAFYIQRKLIEQSFGVGYRQAEEIMGVLDAATKGEMGGAEAMRSIEEMKKTGEQLLAERVHQLDKTINKLIISFQNLMRNPELKRVIDGAIRSIEASTTDFFTNISKFMDKGDSLPDAIWKAAKGPLKDLGNFIYKWSLKATDFFMEKLLDTLSKVKILHMPLAKSREDRRKEAIQKMGEKQYADYYGKFKDKSSEDLEKILYGPAMARAPNEDLIRVLKDLLIEKEGKNLKKIDFNTNTNLATTARYHDGSPALMYQLPRLPVGDKQAIVREGESVLTKQQAQAVTQTAASGGSTQVVVKHLCPECLNVAIEDGVNRVVSGARYNT